MTAVRLTRDQLRNLIVETVSSDVMTAGSLIQLLQGADPGALVFIENHGEFRAVHKGDVAAADGGGLTTDDGEFEDYEGPVILFSAWS
jgi:regulator of RNase E activity RraB